MAQAMVRNDYPRRPGKDYITGSIRTPVIDTGIEIDRLSEWGRLYLSADTVGNYARMLGWVEPVDHAALQTDYDNLEIESDLLRDALADADSKLDEQSMLLKAALSAISSATGGDEIFGSEPFTEPESFPNHVGGGWYELSDGNRIRGESTALAAEAALEDD